MKQVYVVMHAEEYKDGYHSEPEPESAWESKHNAELRLSLLGRANGRVAEIPLVDNGSMVFANGDHLNPLAIGNRGFTYEAFKDGYRAYGTKRKNPYPKKLALELWEQWHKGREAAKNE